MLILPHLSAFLHQNIVKNYEKHKKQISISIWITQHPNTGQNIQQFIVLLSSLFILWVSSPYNPAGSYSGRLIASYSSKKLVAVALYNSNFFYLVPCPPPGLLPVLGPLGSGTDATHLPCPALQL